MADGERPSHQLPGWLRFGFVALAGVSLGYSWTVGQSGLETTNKNLCDLARSVSGAALGHCEVEHWIVGLWIVFTVVAASYLLYETFRFILAKSRRQRLTMLWIVAVFCGAGLATSVFFLGRGYATEQPRVPRSETTTSAKFAPEIPKGRGGKKCLEEALQELRPMLANMRDAAFVRQIPTGRSLTTLLAQFDSSRQIHEKLMGPGEGVFFSSRPECIAPLRALFPAETQAAWDQYHAALFQFINGLQWQQTAPAPVSSTRVLDFLERNFATAASSLHKALVEITNRVTATDEAMQ